jgi:hypothetical protein
MKKRKKRKKRKKTIKSHRVPASQTETLIISEEG